MAVRTKLTKVAIRAEGVDLQFSALDGATVGILIGLSQEGAS